jgi:hypothetical protein
MPGIAAEFADALQRAIYATGDLLHERIAALENIARDIHEAVGVRCVRQIVDGEDQRFRETSVSRVRNVG